MHEQSGLLIADPHDLPASGGAIECLLGDGELSARLGAAARRRVLYEYLGDRHLEQYGRIFQHLAERT